MRKLTFTFLIFSTTFFSCNIFSNNSLVGRKLYFLYKKDFSVYGVTVPLFVEELEFNFVTKDEIQVRPTVFYGTGNAKDAYKNFKLNYTYKDGYLTILNINAPTVKLTENDDFYSTSGGETYYIKSILNLPQDEKKK